MGDARKFSQIMQVKVEARKVRELMGSGTAQKKIKWSTRLPVLIVEHAKVMMPKRGVVYIQLLSALGRNSIRCCLAVYFG